MPLPPPGRSINRSKPAHAASIPSSAMVAPFIVPRRTSSITAATTSAPTTAATRGASPLWAWLVSAVAGNQKGYRNAAAPTATISEYTAIGRRCAAMPVRGGGATRVIGGPTRRRLPRR
jgi:hypothetical protein